MAPLVSVIVPVYNTSAYLRECLDSLLAQTYRELEILCVNDGSTDNSPAILEEYAARDSRIRVITQENAGLGAARNAALDAATGEWVVCVDSDDTLEPDILSAALAALEPDTELLQFRVRYWMPDGSYQYPNTFRLRFPGRQEMTPRIAAFTSAIVCDKLLKRSLIEAAQLRFPRGLLNEDESFTCRYLMHTQHAVYLDRIGYNYRQRAESIMGQSKKVYHCLHYIANIEFVWQHYLSLGTPTALQRAIFINWLGRMYDSGLEGSDAAIRTEMRERVQPIARKLAEGGREFVVANLLDLPAEGERRLFRRCTATRRYYRFFGLPLFRLRMRKEKLLIQPF